MGQKRAVAVNIFTVVFGWNYYEMDKELETALKTVLKKLTVPSAATGNGFQKLLDVANAPVSVTVGGGILLALISVSLTQCYANISKQHEVDLAYLNQRQSFIESFSTKIEMYLGMTLSIRRREFWLKEYSESPDRETARYL